MRFQIWKKDEYGYSSIVGTVDSTEKAWELIHSTLNSENIENPLTEDEMLNNWTTYTVVYGESSDNDFVINSNFLYAGKNSSCTKDLMNNCSDMDNFNTFDIDSKSKDMNFENYRVYLGTVTPSKRSPSVKWFLKNLKKEIVKISDSSILEKSFLFVKVIK